MIHFVNNKVSIIITCFNQDLFISECIQSVISQSYKNWDCIIIDDGSTDNTRSICEKFELSDARIRYIYQNNNGVIISRNNGFKLSDGEFLHFLDGDDYLASEKFSFQVQLMKTKKEIGICYSNHKHFFHHKNISVQYKFNKLPVYPLAELLYEYDSGVSIPLHSAMFRRTIWNLNDLPFEESYSGRYEDWVFWVNLALKNIEFYFLNCDFAFYRIHHLNFCNNQFEVLRNSIKAMIFISEKLSVTEKEKFLENRQIFFFNRYQEYLNSQGGSSKFLKKIKNIFFENTINKVRYFKNYIFHQFR